MELALRIVLRLALCAAVSWGVWRVGGLAAMVATAPLYGIALARPLVELASNARHLSRVAVWQPLEGRHHAFRGIAVQVLEDTEHHRWVRAADVRRIVGHTASDAALALTYPQGWRMLGQPAQPHIRADALVAHLRTERSPEALRLRQWVEREVAFPAQRVRERAR